MILSRILLAAAAVTLLATSAVAETPAEAATHMPAPVDSGIGLGGHGHGGGWHRLLTDNERMMLRFGSRHELAGMTTDQKKAYRKQQRDRFLAMSPADRAAFKADLDARWEALPEDKRARIMARMQAHRSEHGGSAVE